MNLKKFEDYQSWLDSGAEGTDEEYVQTPEYFIESYENGNFSQCRSLLKDMVSKGSVNDLLNDLDMYPENKREEIKNWLIDNLSDMLEEYL